MQGLNDLHTGAHEWLMGIAALQKFLHEMSPCSIKFPENLTGPQLVKEFRAFYVTRKFITAFTRASHLSLSLSQINPFHAPIQLFENLFFCYSFIIEDHT
jgi:hypothetical protein